MPWREIRQSCTTIVEIPRIIMNNIIRRFLREDRGVTAIEYALIAGLIALAIVTSLNNVRTSIVAVFTNIVTSLTP